MRALEDSLLNELRTRGPVRYLVAVSDMAELKDDEREVVRARFANRTYPLLHDPALEALHPYSPLLLTAQSADENGYHHLVGTFSGDMRNALHGWIVSVVPPDRLALHLAHASVAHGPDGAAYLLRYFDPFVLPVLYQHADSLWWQEFIAPIVSWWVPRADTQIQRWGRIPGHGAVQASPPPPLVIDEPLWQALTGDPLSHRLLQAAEAHTPALFDTTCRGMRLARVEAHLAKARGLGLSSHEDLHDYVFMVLSRGAQHLAVDRAWQQAVHRAASGTGRLGDLYLALVQRQA